MADSSPWLGGAGIVGAGRCSSGFGVRGVEPGSSAPFGLLTAAHCRGDGDGLFRNGDRTRVMGPDDGRGDLPLDSRLVPVDEAGARIYTGGVGGSAEFRDRCAGQEATTRATRSVPPARRPVRTATSWS